MKKSLVLAAIATMILSQSISYAASLNLTEEQRQKAHEIRMKGHEQIKPVFEQIKAKKQEIKEIKMSNLSEEKKQKKIEPLKNDLRKLKTEVRKIHEENMKEFEAILTPEQKAEFEKIKQQGRENFKKHHKRPHHPMKPGFNPDVKK